MPHMRFGIFLAPFHPVGQNPTLALERDLELIQHIDRLGFDEAWIGEHHSAGYEIIASPEVFIAVAAERTKHIKLGTGVNSLPYHHPLLLADRMVLLDHLTRGRAMLGCGPGQLTSDAHMLGIEANDQRPRMDEGLDAVMALLRGDGPVDMKTEWFELRDARLQLAPYSEPCFDIVVAASISPAGPRAAARHGLGLLSVGATSESGFDVLGQHWGVMEETAAEHDTTVDRSQWRLVGPMHLAETKEQARRDVEFGLVDFANYFRHVLPVSPVGTGETLDDIIEEVDRSGFAVIGTPDDAIAQIERLVDQSGGFGSYMIFAHEWADREATLKSYELFARYVMPHFQGSMVAPAASCDWVTGSGGEFVGRAGTAIMKAISDHAQEKEEKVAKQANADAPA
jgi:limonene 1,2-monooxygenase